MASQPSFRAVAHVRRPRLSDTITDQIEDLIATGKLKPGDRMPAERDLAQQLDVSRPSLREALLILESRGLLQARRGGGFSVTDVTAPTITDPLVHLLQRHPETVDDILELRHGLECVAAEFAAMRATEADDKRLRAVLTGQYGDYGHDVAVACLEFADRVQRARDHRRRHEAPARTGRPARGHRS